MGIPEFFLERYTYLHDQFFPGLRQSVPSEALRKRPVPEVPPIAWLIWHMARVEDVGLSRFIWQKPQLFDEQQRKELGIEPVHYGTSMSPEEVDELSQTIDLAALHEYHIAVSQRTRQELKVLDVDLLDQVVSEEEVRRIVTDEGMASEAAQWVIPHYVGKTRAWILCHFGLTHNFRHFGQIVLIKKMLHL